MVLQTPKTIMTPVMIPRAIFMAGEQGVLLGSLFGLRKPLNVSCAA